MINVQYITPAGDYFYEVVEFTMKERLVLEIVIGAWRDSAFAGEPFKKFPLSFQLDAPRLLDHNFITQLVEAHPGPAEQESHAGLSFSVTTGVWVDPRPLEDMKNSKWETMKLKRAEALTAHLTTPYGVFDAGFAAQRSITDAILMLQAIRESNPEASIDFTLADNTTVTLNLQQMTEVGIFLGIRTQEVYAKGRMLRDAIEAASTAAEIAAIEWT